MRLKHALANCLGKILPNNPSSHTTIPPPEIPQWGRTCIFCGEEVPPNFSERLFILGGLETQMSNGPYAGWWYSEPRRGWTCPPCLDRVVHG